LELGYEIVREAQISILLDSFDRARYQQHAHYKAAKYYRHRHRMIGIPTVILGAIVSTAFFVSLSTSEAVVPVLGVSWQVATGVLSILATVLVALVNFFSYAPQAKKHDRGGQAYGAIRRRIEPLLAEPTRAVSDDAISSITEQLNAASKYPDVPNSVRDQAKEELGKKPPEFPKLRKS
jgi:membrane protein implicated in regulation of membrane protease activity